MKRTLHALMIGINRYADPRHNLRGCLNDLNDFREFLKENFDNKKRKEKAGSNGSATEVGWKFNCKVLKDQNADRQNIIDHFKHFEKAKSGDICLLYYSGHGSQSAAPPEFWHESPNRMLETIVCHDSRRGNGRDLVDKELRYLIWKATHNKDVHFVAVMDCCHSGSVTRGNNVTDRMAEPNPIGSNLKDYLGVETYKRIVREDGDEEFSPPRPQNFVALAASRDRESAKELLIDGSPRGIFTYSLVNTLRNSNGQLSYAELMNKVGILVRNGVKDQSPQLEATTTGDKFKLFLDGAVKPTGPDCLISYNRQHQWVVNKGAVHGMVPSISNEKTIIELKESGDKIEVTEVMPTLSKVSGMEGKDTGEVYDAVVLARAIPRIKVGFASGMNAKVKKLFQKLLPTGSGTYFELTPVRQADYWIRTADRSIQLTHPGEDRPIFKRVKGYEEGHVNLFINQLDHVGRWVNVKDISNPSSTIGDEEIELDLYRVTDYLDHDNDDVKKEKVDWRSKPVFRYEFLEDEWRPPALQLKVKNQGRRALWVSGVNLSDDFGITNQFLQKESLEAGRGEVWFMDSDGSGEQYRTIPLYFNPAYLSHGLTEVSFFIKIFISTEEFDTDEFNQESLDMDVREEKTRSSMGRRGRIQKPDWTTKEIEIILVHPAESTQLSKEVPAKLSGVKIKGHSGFAAKVKLNQTNEATRGVGVAPPHQVAGLVNMHPLELVHGQASSPGLSVMEFFDTEGAETVDAVNPLILQLDQKIKKDETVLPIGYDPVTGMYYPLGTMTDSGDIVIEDLPDETPSGERSLLGSIKIYFQKVIVTKFLGGNFSYPLLQMALVDESENLSYERDKEKIKAAVAGAENVVMFIHGIIGDTEEMTKAVQRAKNAEGTSINEQYDLVLTFDYENLNTPISETATKLKERLAEVGLGPNHGKIFHIMAHSMGGLVSRWFIEKEGGNEVVSHLVQLGTPNAGSEWASIQELATTLLARALNGASFLQPWLVPLSIAGKYINKMFNCLQEMHVEKSEFLKALNDGTDPGIPYTIIAGNTSLIPVVFNEKEKQFLRRLIRRFRRRGHYDALDVGLFKGPNDIAVRVDSITGIPERERRQFIPQVIEVPCDHISYFADKEGLRALATTVFSFELSQD